MGNRRSFIRSFGIGGIAATNFHSITSMKDILSSSKPEKHIHKFKDTKREFNSKYENEHLNKIAFPIGGIGAGMFCLEGTGSISHLSVNNRPEIFNVPYIFAALSVKGIKNGTKVLESTVPPWKLFGPPNTANGLGKRNYGLPRFETGSFLARFPFGIIELKDKDIPLEVKITGWSPFIPTDEDNSSLPIGVIEYTFKNITNKNVEAIFSYNSRNFIDEKGYIKRQKNGYRLLQSGDKEKTEKSGFAIYIDDNNAIIDHCWFRGGWFDSQTVLWENIQNRNTVSNPPIEGVSPGASIYLPISLNSNQEKTVKVNFCWYLPNSNLSIGNKLIKGIAFTGKPTKEDIKHQNKVSGFAGNGYINSFDPKGDEQVGILMSPKFEVNKPYLKFLIGGGNYKHKTSVNLLINNKIVKTAVGNNSEELIETIWDLRKYLNKKAQIKIIDLETSGWGHILVDQFILTDNKNESLYNPSSSSIVLSDFENDNYDQWEIIKPDEMKNIIDPSELTYSPWYANRFKNIDELVKYWNTNSKKLKKNTELFCNSFYDSSLPSEVIEAVAANLTILKSPTILRVRDGRLWAWEGCYDSSGCCHGSCTHVWNYAQAIPHLFPRLERSLRETEFLVSQNKLGHQNFRSNIPITPTKHDFHAAADGQLGGIMKVYRDWRISGDTLWMKRLFPYVKDSLDYCINTWDPKKKGYLEEPHHNTYDIEFWGPNGMSTSFYLGALTSFIEMSKYIHKPYKDYESLLSRGIEYMQSDLFNGEYFIQKIIWKGLEAPNPVKVKSFGGSYSKEALLLLKKEGPKYQYGTGCLSDGIIGMWMSSICGLLEKVDSKKVKSHLESVYKYNHRKNLMDHYNPQRSSYACGEEGGLLLCTWPKDDALSLPFVYSNEVWTGIEYQVASHLMLHNEIEKGLDIVRTCRKRYDGTIRNPFDEYECGHWYARAMSSYALLYGLTGMRYDAVDKTLYIDSRVGNFKSFISTATGFGTIELNNNNPSLEVFYGVIKVEKYNISGNIIDDKNRIN